MSKIRKRVGLNPRTRKNVDNVMSAIRRCDYTEQIRTADLREIIMRVVGHDPRTIRNMIQVLEMEEKIARVNQYVYQLLGEDLATLDEFDVGDVKLEKEE